MNLKMMIKIFQLPFNNEILYIHVDQMVTTARINTLETTSIFSEKLNMEETGLLLHLKYKIKMHNFVFFPFVISNNYVSYIKHCFLN